MIEESKRNLAFVPWEVVRTQYDWSAKPTRFVTIEGICKECGFEPSPGELMSVSKRISMQGIRLLKHRGKRGAMMPPLICANQPTMTDKGQG